jgi:hypothetical protein
MIINRIYEHQNLLLLYLVSFLVGLRNYQQPCIRHMAWVEVWVCCSVRQPATTVTVTRSLPSD